MRVTPKDINRPLHFEELPREIQVISKSLLDGLKAILNDNLWGIYLYGAMVFPETRYIQDIDFHVILKRKPTSDEKERVKMLHQMLNSKFPQFKDELDGYYILLSDARQISTPWHQIYPDIPDESWPLHIAHMRAGYCIVMFGPEPKSVLPVPTWEDFTPSLEASLKHTFKYLDMYPDYSVLNFCRILYSYRTKNVVVSKRQAAVWSQEKFPEWSRLIECALRVFEREEKNEDRSLLQYKIREFHQFLCQKIGELD